jgi:hypothetical protein
MAEKRNGERMKTIFTVLCTACIIAVSSIIIDYVTQPEFVIQYNTMSDNFRIIDSDGVIRYQTKSCNEAMVKLEEIKTEDSGWKEVELRPYYSEDQEPVEMVYQGLIKDE